MFLWLGCVSMNLFEIVSLLKSKTSRICFSFLCELLYYVIKITLTKKSFWHSIQCGMICNFEDSFLQMTLYDLISHLLHKNHIDCKTAIALNTKENILLKSREKQPKRVIITKVNFTPTKSRHSTIMATVNIISIYKQCSWFSCPKSSEFLKNMLFCI